MAASKAEIERMEELQARLREAADAYYNDDVEIMTNYEYDALYDELVALEEKTGKILGGSITQRVGSDVSAESGLAKVEHDSPMLSLGKTKSRAELVAWLGDRLGCLSYKLDGSTVVLTYEGGRLSQAVTRGNGRIGEDVTAQARKFEYVPQEISFEGRLVVRGEALMTYSEFERINAEQGEGGKYRNPRNLASGTMRALDLSVLDEREIEFHPFTLVEAEGLEENSYSARLDWLAGLGFVPVEHWTAHADELEGMISEIEETIDGQDCPSDGLVLFFDDVEYGDSLGSTGHHPRNGIAFKWQDEQASTALREIKWQTSRTGRINPVAVFDPVELDGTVVSRATLNNLDFIEERLGRPYVGQPLSVIKANLIIPTIVDAEKLDDPTAEGYQEIALIETCPVCGSPVSRRRERHSDFLYCDNGECPSRQAEALAHFVSRDALDVRGLSRKTLSELISADVVSSFKDVLTLDAKEGEIVRAVEREGKKTVYEGLVKGFNKQSFDNLAAAVKSARRTTASRFLYALGIREIGRSASRDICEEYANDLDAVISDAAAGKTDRMAAIAGIGPVMTQEIAVYMRKNEKMVRELLSLVEITDAGQAKGTAGQGGFVAGKTFVVTGAVHRFKNRDELKDVIEGMGGHVSGSVSKNTSCLITNTPNSGTSKNKKAREMGIDVITEDEFCEKAGIA